MILGMQAVYRPLSGLHPCPHFDPNQGFSSHIAWMWPCVALMENCELEGVNEDEEKKDNDECLHLPTKTLPKAPSPIFLNTV